MTTANDIADRFAARARCLAGVMALASLGIGAGATNAGAQEARSLDTRSIINGPLLEELSAGPLPSRRLSMDPHDAAHEPYDPVTAWAIAYSGLTVSSADQLRSSFGAFRAPQTVIARSAAGSELRVAMYDAEQPGWVRAALAPSGVDMPAWRFSAGRPRGWSMALRYEGRFDSPGGDGELDMGLRPRAGLSFGDAGSATEFGATVRLGQYVGAEHEASGGWWFFAGADRQALIYRPGDERTLRETFSLQPYAMVGDQQAGLALRVQGIDVSLAYIRRETSWSMPNQSWDTSEDFAAFSLTWQR